MSQKSDSFLLRQAVKMVGYILKKKADDTNLKTSVILGSQMTYEKEKKNKSNDKCKTSR